MTRDTRGTTQYNDTISAAGRIARVAIGTSVRADYTYDGKSRLATRVTQNQAGAGKVSFSRLCCAKPVPTFAAKPVERLFHDNDNRVIAEVNATGTTVREYIWMDDLPVAVLDGSTSTTNPTLFWVHADHLNRPVAMCNAAKAWVWRAQYEPFGAVHQIVGPAANDSRFPGQWFQLEAGLAYNWHRHYDATLGRYTQPDPLGLTTLLSDGPSVYGYAGQSPLMNVDPTGEWWWLARPVVGGIVGTLADAGYQYLTNACGVDWSTAFLRGGLIGAGFAQAGPAGPLFGRQFYRGKGQNTMFNSGENRFGWSWNAKTGRHEFGAHGGSRKNGYHHTVPTPFRDTKGWW